MTVHPSQPPPEDPHEGSEDDPRRELDPLDEAAAIPPRRYEPMEVDHPVTGEVVPSTMDRVTAASVPLAVGVFMILGFTTGMWYIAWVVFLIPAALKAWNRPDED